MEIYMSRMFVNDIETLSTPEKVGYAIVIPNYAVVRIPERLMTDLQWMYVRMPINEQIEQGLAYDEEQAFWNECKTTFPDAYKEMAKSYDIEHDEVIINGRDIPYPNVPEELRKFIHGSNEINPDTKMFGNGCHFDASITMENHRIRYDDSNLWNYSSPQNLRTLRLLLSEKEESNMKYTIMPYFDAFCNNINSTGQFETLCLHNPLFDAAKEALMASWCLNLLKNS